MISANFSSTKQAYCKKEWKMSKWIYRMKAINTNLIICIPLRGTKYGVKLHVTASSTKYLIFKTKLWYLKSLIIKY